MPIIDQTAFQAALPREARIPPPGEMVITPETLERLKVPDEVLLRPESVNPFMAGQWVKLNDIVNRPMFMTSSAEIPEYIHDESFSAYPSGLSQDERQALTSWYDDNKERFEGAGGAGGSHLVGIQTGGPMNDEDLRSAIDEIIRNHPELSQGSPPAGEGSRQGSVGPDMLDQVLLEKFNETEEEKKKFWAAIAASKGNAEAINTVLGWRLAKQISKRIGKLVESFSFHVDDMHKLQAAFDLENKKGPISAADLAGFNAKLSAQSTDTSLLMQAMTKSSSDLERVTADTNRTNTDIGRPLQLMIQNFRST